MPNTSSSVPYLLSSSMQSIRSRRPSAVLGGSQGSGLLQQLGSGMVRLTSSSHQPVNGRAFTSSTVRKCPSLNITFSWMYVRMTVTLKISHYLLLLPHSHHLYLSCIIIHRRGLLKYFISFTYLLIFSFYTCIRSVSLVEIFAEALCYYSSRIHERTHFLITSWFSRKFNSRLTRLTQYGINRK